MSLIKHLRSAEAVHRKLREISAMLADPPTTGHEKANAAALKTRLEQQLGKEAAKAPRTDLMFRLGQTVKNVRQSAPPSPKGDWTDHAFRLGRAFRRSFDK
jgi:hypothetical protein